MPDPMPPLDAADAASAATPTVALPRRGAARRSTLVVMLATLLTKVVGLAREVVLSFIFGAGGAFSAFTVAFQIPNVIRTFVADQALTSSIVPVFTDLKEKGEEERAWRVASTMVTVLLLLLVPLTALAMWAAPYIVDIAVHDRFKQLPLAIELFRYMIPVVVLMSVAGVVIGVLNSYGKFGAPAFAQLGFNAMAILFLLVGIRFVDHSHRIHVYAAAITVATIVQMLLPVPSLSGHGHRLRLGTAFRDPAVKAILVTMVPVMLSLAMLNLNNIVNTYWSTRIPVDVFATAAHVSNAAADVLTDTGPAVMFKAFIIFQLPQGIFSLAVTTVFFPLFARHSARGDTVAFRDACAAGMRQIIVLLMPASVFLFVLAEPIVRLLYERGGFTPEQTLLTAAALRGFALGLIGNGGIQLFMRAFFSIRSAWTPAAIGTIFNFAGNILLGWILHERYGVFGIGASMAIANLATFLVMWLVLRHRLGGMPVRQVASAFVLSFVAAGVAVGVGWLAWRGIDGALGRGLAGQLLGMLAAVGLTYGIFGAAALRLRLVNVAALKESLSRRRG